jgi:phage-related protein
MSLSKKIPAIFYRSASKTQQTNPADIELATKRLKEWIHGQSN